jgi:hypothetical protein
MEPENEQDLLKAIVTIKQNGKDHYRGRDYMARYFDRNILAQTMFDIILSVTEKDEPRMVEYELLKCKILNSFYAFILTA